MSQTWGVGGKSQHLDLNNYNKILEYLPLIQISFQISCMLEHGVKMHLKEKVS